MFVEVEADAKLLGSGMAATVLADLASKVISPYVGLLINYDFVWCVIMTILVLMSFKHASSICSGIHHIYSL